MTELTVPQRSPEWFKLRGNLCLTASRFGEALGIGRGKPYDFLIAAIMADDEMYKSVPSKETRHGVDKEPLIDIAYQRLTGYVTVESGLWIPDKNNTMYSLIGASPDGKVFDDQNNFIGLTEYKAPVYQLYNKKRHPPFGIPRTYMAQMQAQMSVCNQSWCDFLAICTATQDIMLQRVYFSPVYWKALTTELHEFCAIFKVARSKYRVSRESDDPLTCLDFPEAQMYRKKPIHPEFYPGEETVKVINMLNKDDEGNFVTQKGTFTYDYLMGDNDPQVNGS